jgi:hypothetical protein
LRLQLKLVLTILSRRKKLITCTHLREVFKIDYDTQKNAFYVRWLLDELVEVSPKKYLGKILLKLPFGFNFAVGYFNLEK